jgi:hypothetical protein
MLRLETETGWWLITHPDHARLAGAFAERWGNEMFLPPEPRARVLKGIARHDDGWAGRDAMPQITRQGKPSAFSVELVGKYSAFEDIDLADYLGVRDRALRLIAEEDAYAAILVSMHTYSLLTDHADRSTIAPAELPLLDEFLDGQKEFQASLMQRIVVDSEIAPELRTKEAILDHFRLLQATDNLSLMTCVDFSSPSNLLHPLPLRSGGYARVEVRSIGTRHFELKPYPFALPAINFRFSARHVVGKVFHSAQQLQRQYNIAPPEMLSVTVNAG